MYLDVFRCLFGGTQVVKHDFEQCDIGRALVMVWATCWLVKGDLASVRQ